MDDLCTELQQTQISNEAKDEPAMAHVLTLQSTIGIQPIEIKPPLEVQQTGVPPQTPPPSTPRPVLHPPATRVFP